MSTLEKKFYDFINSLRAADKKIAEIEKNGDKKGILDGSILEFFPEPDINLTQEGIVKQFSRLLYKTKVYEYKGKTVVGQFEVVNEAFGGAVSEIVLLSDASEARNKQYSVQVITDGNIVYDDTWERFEAKSNYFTDLSAFDDGTFFALLLNNIFFNETIRILIYDADNATFDSITVKTIRRVGV